MCQTAYYTRGTEDPKIFWLFFVARPLRFHCYGQRLPLSYLQGLLGNDWGAGQTRNTSSTGSPFVDEDRLRAFLKRPCAQRARELLNLAETI